MDMRGIMRRLAALRSLTRPLALTIFGIVLLKPVRAQVTGTLDDGTEIDIKQIRQIVQNPIYAKRHIDALTLHWPSDPSISSGPAVHALPRIVADALAEADALVLGPGSLF